MSLRMRLQLISPIDMKWKKKGLCGMNGWFKERIEMRQQELTEGIIVIISSKNMLSINSFNILLFSKHKEKNFQHTVCVQGSFDIR